MENFENFLRQVRNLQQLSRCLFVLFIYRTKFTHITGFDHVKRAANSKKPRKIDKLKFNHCVQWGATARKGIKVMWAEMPTDDTAQNVARGMNNSTKSAYNSVERVHLAEWHIMKENSWKESKRQQKSKTMKLRRAAEIVSWIKSWVLRERQIKKSDRICFVQLPCLKRKKYRNPGFSGHVSTSWTHHTKFASKTWANWATSKNQNFFIVLFNE